nr:hypothetical protein [Microbacterium sp. NIBRBAC000506063]
MPGAGLSAHMAVAGEGMGDEHRVVARLVERAPGLVGETDGGQLLTALGAERPRDREPACAGGVAVAPGAGRRRARTQQTHIGFRHGR